MSYVRMSKRKVELACRACVVERLLKDSPCVAIAVWQADATVLVVGDSTVQVASRSIHPDGGQFDFMWPFARTPDRAYVWRA